MKNYIKVCFASLALFGFLSLPNSTYAGWEYYSDVSIDIMNGRTYIVSHCEDKIGDDCTHPGSATRMDISPVVDLLEGYGIIRKL